MESGRVVINLDILFLNDLVMSLVLLWATGKFAQLKINFKKLLLSGTVGSLYTVLLVFPIFSQASGFLNIFLHIILNLFTATLMVYIAFKPGKLKKFIKTLGYFYLITFLAGGAALSFYFMVGTSPTRYLFDWIKIDSVYAWLYLLAFMVAIVSGRFGWTLVRERLYKEKFHLKFKIWANGRYVQVTGLLDTGNMLRDPLSRLPVIIVQKDAIFELFPPDIQKIFTLKDLDKIDLMERLLKTNWYNKFQLIPYLSLEEQGSLLVGFKPDKVEISGSEERESGRVILALHFGDLDIEGDYQALLHPELLEAI